MIIIKSIYIAVLLCNIHRECYGLDKPYVFIEKANRLWENTGTKQAIAAWNYLSNMNTETETAKNIADAELDKVAKQLADETKKYDWKNFKDKKLQNFFAFYADTGESGLPPADDAAYRNVSGELQRIFQDANDNPPPDLVFPKPEPAEIIKPWVIPMQKKLRPLYAKYISYYQELSRLHGYNNTAAYYTNNEGFGGPELIDEIRDLWEVIKPAFEQLHAYRRSEYRKRYGVKLLPKRMPIKKLIYDQTGLLNPFPNAGEINMTILFELKNYTVRQIVKDAEVYFKSMGLPEMPADFWENSVFERINGREMNCDSQAWDLGNNLYRIRVCVKPNDEAYFIIHHEMGHLQNFMAYHKLTLLERGSPNGAFSEGVASTFTIPIKTESHLKKLGLIKEESRGRETTLKFLLGEMLGTFEQLPWGMVILTWHWGVITGQITEENYNCEWWKRKVLYEGEMPGIETQTTEDRFEPGRVHHLMYDIGYEKYFIGILFQYHLFEKMCIAAKQYDPEDPKSKPLCMCDIMNSKEAGNLIRSLMELGKTMGWREILQKVTGSPKINANSVLRYFAPIIDWLKEYNKNQDVGWDFPKTGICKADNTSIDSGSCCSIS